MAEGSNERIIERCASPGCTERPGVEAAEAAEFADLVERLQERISPPPSVGWTAYCKEHLYLFYSVLAWDPEAPLWRPDLVRCRVEACPGVAGIEGESKLGRTEGPGGELLDGLCWLHQKRFAIYGGPARPRTLVGRKRCTQIVQPRSDPGTDVEPPEYQCSEPSVANSLCLMHVVGKGGDIVRARAVVASWDAPPGPTQLSQPTDDTWRVLEEFQATRDGVPTRAQMPFIFDGLTLGLTMTMGIRDWKHILHWALKYSPHEIGAALDMPWNLAAAHAEYLVRKGHIVEDPHADLPIPFGMVVRQVRISGRVAASWRRTKIKHRLWDLTHYHPGYVIQQLPERLPAKGETRYIPLIEGPGLLSEEHQGRVWILTEKGQARLRQWRQEEAERERRDLAEKADRRLALIGAFVGVMALVSIIADAKGALENLRSFWDWVAGML